MRTPLLFLVFAILTASCQSKKTADLLIYNATIYTVDSQFSKAEAMAIQDGKILATGTKAELTNTYSFKDSLNAEGKYIYPGFIDAHAHFAGYAQSLTEINLFNTSSWDSIIERVVQHQSPTGDTSGWIVGRGWDQNDWPVKAFPTNERLNARFPDRPVYLVRIDGHAAIANNKALELAGIKAGDTISGGEFVIQNGRLTGVLVDNAMDRVAARIPFPTDQEFEKSLQLAQQNCFATGLTTIHDCGLNYELVEKIQFFQEKGSLKMRLFVLLSDAKKNYDYLTKRGSIKTDRLKVSGFKLYGDGALGSRGACLLKDYSDKPGWKGFLLSDAAHFDSMAALIIKNKWQMCTHAIGDSGNRVVLNIYAKYLNGKNDLRWRIEHAQVVNESDFHYFKDHSILPSVQPTHATSDMHWAGDRLGNDRLKGAYAYQQLLQQNGWISLGTDFPVEDISPFKTFYAAVIRKDEKGFPAGGFQMENALTREQALRGMTIWAARSAFEELEKGSLEAGKLADFIVLDQDIMTAPEQALLKTKVIKTFLNGEMVYKN
ncbi:amidohydrolase [Niabella yanshanensis]|uniref:Amidohydrolase n=1 Tax=Niabella yanshanensis TaxID=577386 RepID=A0ABZ0W2Y9_9BACT|nr:amidohydrolase [Niabella yanshanensis]WQD36461.1 amidohydrolase [Niabella yanshanensis]